VQRLSLLQASALDHDPLTPYAPEEIQSEIHSILHRHDSSLASIRAERRAGRPPSTQEIQLTAQVENDKKEFASGLWIPDMTDTKNLERLREWGGQWIGLNVLKFVRVYDDGRALESSFPPRGQS
jgi:translation machinery-associated protein 16